MHTSRSWPRMLPRLLLVTASIVAVLPLAGCEDGGDGGEWTIAVDTLEGGTVHVTNTPPAAVAPDTWSLAEELRIGSVDERRGPPRSAI